MNDDILFEIFKWLPIIDLLNASLTCIQFNNVALDDYLWHGFCERDYPEDYKLYHEDSYLETYKACYQLSRLMDKCKEKYKLDELYNLKKLYLSNNKLSEVPKELGQLINLRFLHLSTNKLSEVPKELSQLTNLRHLGLSNNKLLEIPKELRCRKLVN